jgi:hypothetical protein
MAVRVISLAFAIVVEDRNAATISLDKIPLT